MVFYNKIKIIQKIMLLLLLFQQKQRYCTSFSTMMITNRHFVSTTTRSSSSSSSSRSSSSSSSRIQRGLKWNTNNCNSRMKNHNNHYQSSLLFQFYRNNHIPSSSLVLSSTSLLFSSSSSNNNNNNNHFNQRRTFFSSTKPLLLSSKMKRHRLYLSGKKTSNDSNIKKQPKSFKKQSPNLYRADRVLANRGYASRSECSKLLKQRRVYIKIQEQQQHSNPKNDDDDDDTTTITDKYIMKKILGPSEKISMDSSLWIDEKIEVPLPPPLLRVYHKPKWVLSVLGDKYGRKNLNDLDFISSSTTTDEEESSKKKKNNINTMHPVGRLDYDTSGLLLFSSNGPLTQYLLHPNHKIEKEYIALVVGTVPNVNELKEQLYNGISTSMGTFSSQLVNVTTISNNNNENDGGGEGEVQKIINDIITNLPKEYDLEKLNEKGYLFFQNAKELSIIQLIVREGKHRMVRRILANAGYPVIGLKRIRLGEIYLNDNLKEGEYRDITTKEEQWVQTLIKKENKKK